MSQVTLKPMIQQDHQNPRRHYTTPALHINPKNGTLQMQQPAPEAVHPVMLQHQQHQYQQPYQDNGGYVGGGVAATPNIVARQGNGESPLTSINPGSVSVSQSKSKQTTTFVSDPMDGGSGLPVEYRLPDNPFAAEKIMPDHPSYPGAAVDVAPPRPMMRRIPLSGPTNMFVTMGQKRNERFKEAYGQEPIPHVPGHQPNVPGVSPGQHATEVFYPPSGAGGTVGAQRLHPPREPSQRLERLELNKTPTRATPESSLLWRNNGGVYNLESQMMQSSLLQHPTDFRLEKRKERQAEYQRRREEEKMRNEALAEKYIQLKRELVAEDVRQTRNAASLVTNGRSVAAW